MRIIIPLGIVGLGLMIYSFVECLQTPRERVRVLGKWSWLAVILLVPLIGAGLWLAFGRVRRNSQQAQQRRPAAPDDDPNFLRGLEIQRRQRQRHEEERRRGPQGHQSASAASSSASEDAAEDPEADPDDETPSPGQTGTGDVRAEQTGTGGQHAEDHADSPHSGDGSSESSGRTPGYRDDVDPDEELDPDDPRL